MDATGNIEVAHTDGLGSMRALTDAVGAVVQTYQTDEFGVVVAAGTQGTRTQPFGYTGEPRDAESGFVYLRARVYDPATGRFLSKDPWPGAAASPQSLNRYAYVGNNPATLVDPSGLVREGTQGASRAGWNAVRPRLDQLGAAWEQGRAWRDATPSPFFCDDPNVVLKHAKCPAPMLQTVTGASVALNPADRAAIEGLAALMGMGDPEFSGSGGTGRNQRQPLKAGEAGRFADLDARRVAGDELSPHHMPQAAAKFTSREDGGALVVPHSQHVQTRTYGSRGAAVARDEAGLPFRDVLARDIRDVRGVAGTEFNSGLRDLIEYYRTEFPDLMTK